MNEGGGKNSWRRSTEAQGYMAPSSVRHICSGCFWTFLDAFGAA